MKNLLLIILAVISVSAFGQDNIILKNGDEIKGKVFKVGISEVEYKKDSTGPVYAIKKSEVFLIKYENGTKDIFTNTEANGGKLSQTETSQKEINKKENKKSSGVFRYDNLKLNRYQPIFEFGGIFGVGNISSTNSNYYIPANHSDYNSYYGYNYSSKKNTQNLFCLRFIQGSRLKGDQFIGFGIELDVSDKVNFYRSMYLPLFVEYRATFMKKRVSPMFMQDLGASFFLPTNENSYAFSSGVVAGGVMTNTALGINIQVTNKISYHFTVGYRFQHLSISKATYSSYNYNSGYFRQVTIQGPLHNFEHFITLTTGFRF